MGTSPVRTYHEDVVGVGDLPAGAEQLAQVVELRREAEAEGCARRRTRARPRGCAAQHRARRRAALRLSAGPPARYLPVDVPADGDGRGDGLDIGLLQQQVAHIVAEALRERSGSAPAPGPPGPPRPPRPAAARRPPPPHLEVVLGQVLAEPRDLHVLVQVQRRHLGTAARGRKRGPALPGSGAGSRRWRKTEALPAGAGRKAAAASARGRSPVSAARPGPAQPAMGPRALPLLEPGRRPQPAKW